MYVIHIQKLKGMYSNQKLSAQNKVECSMIGGVVCRHGKQGCKVQTMKNNHKEVVKARKLHYLAYEIHKTSTIVGAF